MSKKILIVGKNAASVRDFSEAFTLGDFSVAVADDSAKKSAVPSVLSEVTWNKASAVSARSLIIQTETVLGSSIDDYILFFDTPLYAAEFSSFSVENCQKACDEMISAFQYIAMEAITRIEQCKRPGRIVFVLKKHPSIKDIVVSTAVKNLASIPANPFVAAAESAFSSFAENVSAIQSEKENVSVILVAGDAQNETMANTSALAKWLGGYINASDDLTLKTVSKAAVTWIKPGAKNPGGFSLFR